MPLESSEGGAMRVFQSYHPAVNFVYFACVLGFSMFLLHPVCLAITLLCGAAYAIVLHGRRAVRFQLAALLPMMVVAAAINPAFNHAGMTILGYLPGGNPLTLESVAYGIAAAVLLAAVICWFSCFHTVMSSDKFIYLFGAVIPVLSLLLSMSLRFVPRLKEQARVIANAQKCVGKNISDGSLWQRARHGMAILSCLVSWTLENAIDTADSMKSRGYGLPGRTAYSNATFDRRDGLALGCIAVLGGYVLAGSLLGGLQFRFFPSVKGVELTLYPISIFAAYFALCSLPLGLEVWERHKWKVIELSM